MELELIMGKLNLKYYNSLQFYLNKNDNELEWLDKHINNLIIQLKEYKNSETQTEKKKELGLLSETEYHKQIFSDEELYKKPWVKLNSIHKILKIKEFVNSIKIEYEKDRIELREQLVNLVKNKILTKKEKVKYDEINGKIISLTNLQYKNGKYYYCNE